MPNRDGRGPLGQGPLTGRGFGPCCPRGGRRFRFRGGGGFSRGFGRGFTPLVEEPFELTKEEKKKVLEAELKNLEEEKKLIEKEIKELK